MHIDAKVKLALHLLLSIGFCVVLSNGQLMAAPLGPSISASRQFIVYGETIALRGALADLAEDTKTNLLNLLGQRDEWKVPIILHLEFPQANMPEIPPASLRFSQTGSALKIQLDLTIGTDFDVLA